MKDEKRSLPRISIVTPSYNQGEFLEECIVSILGQNYPDLQYVIMDGGSTDNSVEIIRKYEKYLAYWQSEPDGGQFAAIQKGFENTDGEIMAWLNSDDKYQDNAFFKVAYVMSMESQVDWVTGRHCFWDENGRISYIEANWLPKYSREKYLRNDYDKPFVQQESTFWHRRLWEKAGSHMCADLYNAGDLELWRRFFRYAQLYTIDTPLGGFRVQPAQKTTLASYRKEAERILGEERNIYAFGDQFNRPKPLPKILQYLKRYFCAFGDQFSPPAPLPLRIEPKQLIAYMHGARADGADSQKLITAANHEYIIDYLMQRLIATIEGRTDELPRFGERRNA